ncbi:MAG TPA: hypothetical protein VHO29_03870 [Marmoricola sp.]|nr:hypothetical protein [Marmoricola sp.]
MTPRLLAAAAGALGGLLLAIAGGSSFLARESAGWHDALAFVGYAAIVAALSIIGYGLVAQAPVWLRAIVSVAVPLLGASVWQVVAQTIDDRVDGWKGPATTHLLGGLVALVVALVAFRRADRDRAGGYAPTHHR